MNITSSTIQYIAPNNKVQTFKIPKKDRNINFKKWAYNDVIQYIKLNQQKRENKNKSKSKSKKNIIKYAKLTTVKDNQIINGKKTLDQIKSEAIIAANTYGTNSTQYKSLVEQITQYSKLILERYYEDYIKNNVGPANYENMRYQIRHKLENGLQEMIYNQKTYIIKINDEKVTTETKQHHKGAFSELTGFGFRDEYDDLNNDEKMYFKFTIPNDYTVDNVIDRIIETIGESNFKKLKQFYQSKEDKYFKIDIYELNKNKKDLIKKKLFPTFLTSYKNEQHISIPLDIFQFVMSVNNGEVSNKIYYCQYNTFNENNKFKIIGDDIIDNNFIKYFMDKTIEFKGGDTKIAFISKILDTLLLKINLSIGQYKDIYKNNDNITGTDVNNIFKDDDYEIKMEEEKSEEDKPSSQEIMKRIKEENIKKNQKKNNNAFLMKYHEPIRITKNKNIKSSSSSLSSSTDSDDDEDDNTTSKSSTTSTTITETPKENKEEKTNESFTPIEGVKQIEEYKPKESKPPTELKPINPSTLKDDDEKKEIKQSLPLIPSIPEIPSKPLPPPVAPIPSIDFDKNGKPIIQQPPKPNNPFDSLNHGNEFIRIQPIKYLCDILYFNNKGFPNIQAIILINQNENELDADIYNDFKVSEKQTLGPLMMECNDLFNKKHPKKIDSYYQLIRDELNKIKKYQGTRIEIVDVDCDDNNECLKMYDNIRENYGYEPLNYIDDNEKIESENNNKILIKTKEFIYVAYMLSKASNLMLLRWMAKTEKDGDNQQIIKFKTFKTESKNAEELSGCFAEIAAANNQQCQDKARGKIKLTIQEQQQLFNNIIEQYYPKTNIKYVEYLTDEDAYNAYNKTKMKEMD